MIRKFLNWVGLFLNGLKAYDLTYDPNDNTLVNQKYVEANKIARMF